MSELTRFVPPTELQGYPLHDHPLDDFLFDRPMVDETPEGPTRTWVYTEGEAVAPGFFESIRDGATSADADAPAEAAVLLARIESPHERVRPSWARPAGRTGGRVQWHSDRRGRWQPHPPDAR